MNKFDKLLTRKTKKKKKKGLPNYQYWNKERLSLQSPQVKKYYKLYEHQFLKNHKLLKLTQENTDNLNNSITIQEVEFIV